MHKFNWNVMEMCAASVKLLSYKQREIKTQFTAI